MQRLIEEYRSLQMEIATVKSKIKTKERELDKLKNIFRPHDASGIDYSRPSIQCSRSVPDIVDVAGKIYDVNSDIMDLRLELKDIEAQASALEKTVHDLGVLHGRVLLLKARGMTNRQISYEMGYSRRHIERLISEANKKIKAQ